MKHKATPIEIAGQVIQPGTEHRFELFVGRLVTQVSLTLPVAVVHGVRSGPRIWVSAAVHGDEINGVEIIRQLLGTVDAQSLRGTIVAVPIVNVFGFINESRYLPDRRDLNRSFPGSSKGSLAGRLADLFLREIVDGCTHGIDLHTAADGRINLPQIRANLDDPETMRIAKAFAPRVILHSRLRDGSLRAAAAKRGIPVFVYEAGEAQRYNDVAIRTGTRGLLRVLSELGMRGAAPKTSSSVMISRRSQWLRARRSGLLRLTVKLGGYVTPRQVVGIISDAMGERDVIVRARDAGVVIGLEQNPLVTRGDAIVHVAQPSAEVESEELDGGGQGHEE
jgi:hypothetical protein